MNKKLYIISLLFLTSINIFGQGFKDNEFLKYRVHYGFLNAGFATLTVDETNYNGKPHYHVVGKGSSTGAVRTFYKVENLYETYLDKDEMVPSKFVRQITESNYRKNKMLLFNNKENKVAIYDLKNQKVKYASYPSGVQDMISAFYYLRNKKPNDFRTGTFLSVNVFMDDEVYPFKLKVNGREKINTKFGWINAIKLTPYVQKGRIFKADESVTMWVSDDENLIPLSIEADLTVGSLKMDIYQFKNTKYPLKFQ